jgi:hypothetical protein
MKKIIYSLLFAPLFYVAQSPNITSWEYNTSGHQAQYYDSNGTTVLNLNDSSEVQQVCYNTDSIYVRTNILASFIMGPWTGDPFLADGQNNSYVFPRNPTYPSSTHQTKPTGTMGLLVNGVVIYDDGDGKSYNSTTSTNSNSGAGVWNQIAWVAHAGEMDAGNGHPDPNNVYHNHSNPIMLCSVTSSTAHSPIIGWAFDGWPIYGPFGYATATDATSAITRMTPSWQLRNITTRTTFYDGTTASQTGPAVSTSFPLGTYIEDYEYISGLGDLDYYNGRYCVTPEYPSGTYAYFLNTDASGNAQYPNMIGPKYYGTVFLTNFGGTAGAATAPKVGVSCYTPSTNCTVTLSSQTNVSCNGLSDGAATVSVSGASGTVTYSWTPSGGTAATASNLSSGTYTVSVSDGASCSATQTVSITEPTAITITSTITNATCNGGTNGAINMSVSGGNPLGSGSPGLLISEVFTDPSGSDSPFEFVELLATKAIDFSTTPYTVIFSNNGTATSNGWKAGAGLTYAFEISTGSVSKGDVVYVGGSSMTPTTNVLRSINTGTTAGDGSIGNSNATGVLGNGGTSADGVAVFSTGTSSLTSSSVPVDAIFFGTAAGSAVVSGGTAGYQLPVNDKYSGGKLQSTSYVAPTSVSTQYLRATGTYNLATSSFTTTRTWANTATFTNLASSVTLTNPYTYSWSNSATTEDLSGIGAGTYSVTVTDGSGCTATSAITVTAPSAITASSNITNVNCFGGSTGAIDLSPSGGNATYTYNWNNAATTQDLSALAAGSYSVTITDGNACTGTATVSVTQPASAISLSASSTSASCLGGDGTINLTVSGGTPSYTYAWSNGTTTEDVSALNAGSYSVTVTDANSCTSTTSVTVSSSSGISLSSVVTNATCNGNSNGQVNLTVIGGTAGFTYAWSNSSSSEDLSGLTAGNYSVTVTDANNCTATAALTVTEPAALLLNTLITNVDCKGNTTGGADLSVSGGTASYSYSWNNGAISQDLSSLAAGTYSVTVTDANSCISTTTVTVTEPASALAVTSSEVNNLCNGAAAGSIDLSVTGGTAAYSYAWSNSATSEDLNALAAGTYSVTVTDANACTFTYSASVTEPTAITFSSSISNISCNGGSDGMIDLSVSGGTAGYSYAWGGGETSEDLSGIAAGTYSVDVTDANGCVTGTTITLTEPAVIAITGTVTDEAAGNDGAIDLTASGGTGTISYLWSNGAVTEDLSGLAGGIYSVIVTDANGCTMNDTLTVETTLGVIGPLSSNSSSIFPNPASSFITISSSVQAEKIEIHDLQGKLVYSSGGNIKSIPVSHLNNGVYTVSFIYKDHIEIKRLTKN